MTHNSSDDAGVPCHSMKYEHSRVMQGACFTLFVVPGAVSPEVCHG